MVELPQEGVRASGIGEGCAKFSPDEAVAECDEGSEEPCPGGETCACGGQNDGQGDKRADADHLHHVESDGGGKAEAAREAEMSGGMGHEREVVDRLWRLRGLYTGDEMRHAKNRQMAAWGALAAMLAAQTAAVGQATGQAAQRPDARRLDAQTREAIVYPAARDRAEALAIDRGAAGLELSLKRLGTWASVMDIVAHPDDEDGGMLTFESRGVGARASLLTLTRGEGGQNAMSADTDDALGVLRTNELLRADEYYGVRQYFGTEADFGFSKTQQEAFEQWGHQRVLYDAVLAIRRERPLVLMATFVGGITDGHGQHQVSGEIEQEAYQAAGDPKVFPEQIAAGLKPWAPLKVYGRAPFAPVTAKGMFDYATGKWASARFYNYVTKQWSNQAPSADVEVPSGEWDPVVGLSYQQIARTGWGEQRSQYGGGNPTLSGGGGSQYHLWASRVTAPGTGIFSGIPVGIEGLAWLVTRDGGAGTEHAPAWLTDGLAQMARSVRAAQAGYRAQMPEGIAPELKQGLLTTQALRERVRTSRLIEPGKTYLSDELGRKEEQFETALSQALGLDLQAFTTKSAKVGGGPFGGGIDEMPVSAVPGEKLLVRVHTSAAVKDAKLERVWLRGTDGRRWTGADGAAEQPDKDATLAATVPADEPPTEPYFTRPTVEQPYYDVKSAQLRGEPFAPYPLEAWAEFAYEGVPVRMGEVVETMHREPGRGGVFEPLVVTPPIGVSVEPLAQILLPGGGPLTVQVVVHAEQAATGTVRLKLPAGWKAEPAEAEFVRKQAGDAEPVVFHVAPPGDVAADGKIEIGAEAEWNGKKFTSGWRSVGYPGMRPYNVYRAAVVETRRVDVKVARGLRVGYVMGTGDTVPEALRGLGIEPHLLTAQEIAQGDLSAWDAILIGIRAYSVRPELAANEARLEAYERAGGTVIVQYQSGNFPAPYPLSMGRMPERVVEETTSVKLLNTENPLLTTPNRITTHDFDGWVEERGHSFLDTWDAAYTPLTETADQGQDPQRGGLVVATVGKGHFVYVSYALYRQFPELVPGAYRLLANLVSAGAKTQ